MTPSAATPSAPRPAYGLEGVGRKRQAGRSGPSVELHQAAHHLGGAAGVAGRDQHIPLSCMVVGWNGSHLDPVFPKQRD